jgi:hypothetical protein
MIGWPCSVVWRQACRDIDLARREQGLGRRAGVERVARIGRHLHLWIVGGAAIVLLHRDVDHTRDEDRQCCEGKPGEDAGGNALPQEFHRSPFLAACCAFAPPLRRRVRAASTRLLCGRGHVPRAYSWHTAGAPRCAPPVAQVPTAALRMDGHLQGAAGCALPLLPPPSDGRVFPPRLPTRREDILPARTGTLPCVCRTSAHDQGTAHVVGLLCGSRRSPEQRSIQREVRHPSQVG